MPGAANDLLSLVDDDPTGRTGCAALIVRGQQQRVARPPPSSPTPRYLLLNKPALGAEPVPRIRCVRMKKLQRDLASPSSMFTPHGQDEALCAVRTSLSDVTTLSSTAGPPARDGLGHAGHRIRRPFHRGGQQRDRPCPMGKSRCRRRGSSRHTACRHMHRGGIPGSPSVRSPPAPRPATTCWPCCPKRLSSAAPKIAGDAVQACEWYRPAPAPASSLTGPDP